MRIELASLESGKGAFAHTYAPDELVLEDERVKLIEPAEVEQLRRHALIVGEVTLTFQKEYPKFMNFAGDRFGA